jgi:large subunit ribosomal protein L22
MDKTFISTQKFIRMSPKKLRVVVNAIKNMNPNQAVETLPCVNKAAALPLQKTIKSALANARMQGAKVEDLIFKEIQIGEGPRLKRGIAAPRGRYHPILKRMSHIRVVLTTKEKEVKKVTKKGVSHGSKS